MLQSNPSPAALAEKTIDYAEAKEAYFKALRAEMPELMKIATGEEERHPELDERLVSAVGVAAAGKAVTDDSRAVPSLLAASMMADAARAVSAIVASFCHFRAVA